MRLLCTLENSKANRNNPHAARKGQLGSRHGPLCVSEGQCSQSFAAASAIAILLTDFLFPNISKYNMAEGTSVLAFIERHTQPGSTAWSRQSEAPEGGQRGGVNEIKGVAMAPFDKISIGFWMSCHVSV